MWNKIVNPKTGRKVNINSKIGKSVLRNYMKQLGGAEARLDPEEVEYKLLDISSFIEYHEDDEDDDDNPFGHFKQFEETYETEFLEKTIHIFPKSRAREKATTIVEKLNDPNSVLVRNSSIGRTVFTYKNNGIVYHINPTKFTNYDGSHINPTDFTHYDEEERKKRKEKREAFLMELFSYLSKNSTKKFRYVILPNTPGVTSIESNNIIEREQEEARREWDRREQARREQARKLAQEQARREQARREQDRREQARREQARREQDRREQARREQAQEEQPEMTNDQIDAAIELMKKNSVLNCNSNNNVPVRCNTKKQWRKQTMIFHPDKNVNCEEEALAKWQLFDSDDSCNRFGMGKKN